MAEEAEEEAAPTASFGQLADFLGVPIPDVETGDIITDVAAICFVQGEEGELVKVVANPGISTLKLDGAIARLSRYGFMDEDDYEPPEGV